MLTPSQFDELLGPITDLYESFHQTVLNDIARRIKKMGEPTATAAWQLQRLQESGLAFEDAIKEVSRLTGRSETALTNAFRRAGVETLSFDDSIYRAAGLDPLPLHLSPQMLNVLTSGLQHTKDQLLNLTRSTPVTAKKLFTETVDKAFLQVASGTADYNSAIKNAVIEMADQGITAISYLGHTDQIDVAVRRSVLTGISQTAGRLQDERANDMGVDLVQTSAHIGARPEHGEWQGQVFSRSGTSDKYPSFVESTGYGTAGGLAGVNCRHSFYPFFEGLSKEAYDPEELHAYENKIVNYNGEPLSVYEATQRQRYIERNIRKWKRREGALSSAGYDTSEELMKIAQWQAKARNFVKQTGLPRQYVREGGSWVGKLASMKIDAEDYVSVLVGTAGSDETIGRLLVKQGAGGKLTETEERILSLLRNNQLKEDLTALIVEDIDMEKIRGALLYRIAPNGKIIIEDSLSAIESTGWRRYIDKELLEESRKRGEGIIVYSTNEATLKHYKTLGFNVDEYNGQAILRKGNIDIAWTRTKKVLGLPEEVPAVSGIVPRAKPVIVTPKEAVPQLKVASNIPNTPAGDKARQAIKLRAEGKTYTYIDEVVWGRPPGNNGTYSYRAIKRWGEEGTGTPTVANAKKAKPKKTVVRKDLPAGILPHEAEAMGLVPPSTPSASTALKDKVPSSETMQGVTKSKIGEPARRATELIDQVHMFHPRDYNHRVSVTMRKAQNIDGNAGGTYHRGYSPRINLAGNRVSGKVTEAMVHEMGHYIDNWHIASGATPYPKYNSQFAKTDSPVASLASRKWFKAVTKTDAFVDTFNIEAGNTVDKTFYGTKYKMSQTHAEYLNRPQELWARAYVQYIQKKTGDPQLLTVINARRGKASLYQYYWSDADFEKIEKLMDAIFREEGLLIE